MRTRAGLALALWAGLFLCSPALAAQETARPLPGSEAPAFAEPFGLWLSGNEDEALPLLAEAAEAGNLSARLLLWQIARRPVLHGPWLARLPLAERLALLRDADGRPWITREEAEAEGGIVALFAALERPGAGASIALDLAGAGEMRAARLAVLRAVARGAPDLAEAAADPRFPEGMGVFAGLPEATEALAAGHPAAALAGEAALPWAVARWLETAELAAPVALICARACPGEDFAPCLPVALEAVGRIEGLWRLGSPVEALVSSQDFAASPRGEAVALRQMLLAVRGGEGRLRQIGAQSTCLRDALAEARAAY
ncbi:MAG: hypothetical protein JJU40_11810 [Rhodobacteraceae bacterium]|nr:hypothetical protein [Paracoccaceae bacterium]